MTILRYFKILESKKETNSTIKLNALDICLFTYITILNKSVPVVFSVLVMQFCEAAGNDLEVLHNQIQLHVTYNIRGE